MHPFSPQFAHTFAFVNSICMSKIRPEQCSSSRDNSRIGGQIPLFSTCSEEASVHQKREKFDRYKQGDRVSFVILFNIQVTLRVYHKASADRGGTLFLGCRIAGLHIRI